VRFLVALGALGENERRVAYSPHQKFLEEIPGRAFRTVPFGVNTPPLTVFANENGFAHLCSPFRSPC